MIAEILRYALSYNKSSEKLWHECDALTDGIGTIDIERCDSEIRPFLIEYIIPECFKGRIYFYPPLRKFFIVSRIVVELKERT